MIAFRGWRRMTGRGYTIFDTGIDRCGIAWGLSGIVGVQLPEVREIDTRRLCQLDPDARDLRPPQNVEVAIEGASPTTSKTLFDVLLPVAPPRAHT
jgi:methylated-DNA-[protein]-cysteine S-methyltransferase